MKRPENILMNCTFMLSIFLLSGLKIIAQQQVPNGSFEYWEGSGENTEPQNWNSLMTADMCSFCEMGASQRVFKERTGLPDKGSCIRIESASIFGGIIVNGSVTSGRITAPTIRPSQGYNKTVVGEKDFSLPFRDKPDSLVFWAKYTITDQTDSALVSFLLHGGSAMTDPSEFTKTSHPTGVAQTAFQTNAKWQRVSIPFKYSSTVANESVFLLATFSSSFKAGKGNPKATLWIDEVEMIYNDSGQALKTEFSHLTP